jgi:hypothetical protein
MAGEMVHGGLHARAGQLDAGELQAHLTAASAMAISVRSLQSPRWPMRNMRPLTLPRPVPSEQSKRSWMRLAHRVGVHALGRHHAGEHRRVHRRVGALDLQAPGLDRRAHATAQRWWRANTVSRPCRAACRRLRQAVQQVGVGGVGPVAVLFISMISSQAQKALRQRGFSLASSALARRALKLMPGGSIRPFCEPLTVTSTPHSSCGSRRGQARDGVDQQQRRVFGRVDRLAHGGDVGGDAGGGFVVHHAHGLDAVLGVLAQALFDQSACTPWRQTSAPG